MPGDHSELEPPLPIPNRSVKQLRADDSADTRVKVGHRQALIPQNPQPQRLGVFALGGRNIPSAPAYSVRRRSATVSTRRRPAATSNAAGAGRGKKIPEDGW